MGKLRSWGPSMGIAALVVADVALVYLSVAHVRDASDASTSGSSPSLETSAPTNDDSAEPTPDGTDDAERQNSALGEGPVLMDVAGDGTVIRSSRGSCDEKSAEPVVEVSTDGGVSFERVSVKTELSDVLRVSVSSANDMFLVGADPDCDLAVYRSTDEGASWVSSEGTGGAWHQTPDGGDSLHSPAGRVAPGCDVVALSALSESGARVLCADGQLRGTADGGSSWVGLGSLPGAVAIAYTTPTDGWALVADDECPAAVSRTSDGGADWEQTGCTDADGEAQAIAVTEKVVSAHVGGQVLRSTDDGATFSTPGG